MGYYIRCANYNYFFLQATLKPEWREIHNLSRVPGLHDIAFGVMDIVKKSKSSATNRKYDIYFNKFKSWCLQFKLSHLPALPSTVSMYLTSLIQMGVSVAVLNSNFYAVKWYHNIFLFEDPCVNRLAKLVLEGGKRILSKPIKKKEPITADVIVNLYNFYKGRLDLFNSRSLCMLVLAYVGFFRYKEISNIKMNNLSFYDTHVKICIESSKTDIYRQGNTVIIAKTNTDTCPVKCLAHYCKIAELRDGSDEYISVLYNLIKI